MLALRADQTHSRPVCDLQTWKKLWSVSFIISECELRVLALSGRSHILHRNLSDQNIFYRYTKRSKYFIDGKWQRVCSILKVTEVLLGYCGRMNTATLYVDGFFRLQCMLHEWRRSKKSQHIDGEQSECGNKQGWNIEYPWISPIEGGRGIPEWVIVRRALPTDWVRGYLGYSRVRPRVLLLCFGLCHNKKLIWLLH